MADFTLSAFQRPLQWPDEEVDTRYTYSSTWDRADLNNELFANEQRLFTQQQEDLSDFYLEVPPSPALAPTAGPSNLSQLLDPPPGYMEQRSAFALDIAPTESTFLDSFPKGNATLTYQNENNELESIRNVNVELIEERSPILGMAFETGRSGPQLYLETLTSATALPFLRYLYTGTYALRPMTGEPGDMYEDVPTSVLFHCHLYRLAEIYDLPDLKSQAYVNILRQFEFGCSSPEKPIEVCTAIRYVYEHLKEHENLIDAIVNYCVSCFVRHALAEDPDFRQLAYDLRPFHQSLCKNSMGRMSEAESKNHDIPFLKRTPADVVAAAMAIIQMPFKPYAPDTYASREDLTATKFDHVFHFHSNDRFDTAVKKRRRPEKVSKGKENMSLPLRLRDDTFDPLNWTTAAAVTTQPEDDDYKFGSKRRASSAAKEAPPLTGWISKLRADMDRQILSEPEYEIVERPEPVTTSRDSESDSESGTYVKVNRQEVANEALPIRTKAPAAEPSAKSAAHGDSDSDCTDWELI